MRPLIICVLVVALVAAGAIATGHYSTRHVIGLLMLSEFVMRPLNVTGSHVKLDPQSWAVLLFWLDLIVFATPACGLYMTRKWLRSGYLIALAVWTVLYLWFILHDGRMSDWP